MTPIQNTEDMRATLDFARAERIMANALIAERDAAMAAIENKFAARIKACQETEKAYCKLVQAYATKARKTLLPRDRKSVAVGSHEIGWEDNGGAVKPRRGLTEKKVLERISKAGGVVARLFIRKTPALDKVAIAAKWKSWGAKLTSFGLTYKSEEIFFIKLDVTQAEDNRVTPEAEKVAA